MFFSERFPVLSWQVAMQGAILVFALIGLWRNRRRPETMWLVAAVAVYVVLVHWQVSMLFPRYLYPAMPLLLALAGAGFAAILPGRRHQQLSSRGENRAGRTDPLKGQWSFRPRRPKTVA